MNRVIGILAHVDAGKTTFSEQLLYHAGVLRAAGRVDHQNTLLDAHPLEKQRGITIFSDQAVFERGGTRFFWVDTPGHADFAAEMERALSILDCALLIVNGAEGIQSHTETLWALLAAYNVPTMLFINKTDRAGCDADAVLGQLKKRLSADIVDPSWIATNVYQSRTLESLKLEAITIFRMQVICDGKAAISYVSEEDMQRTGAKRTDVEPLIDTVRSVEGTSVACILRDQDGVVRGNLRSKDDTDVSVLARELGGGGHKAAAGFNLNMPLPEAVDFMKEKLTALLANSD